MNDIGQTMISQTALKRNRFALTNKDNERTIIRLQISIFSTLYFRVLKLKVNILCAKKYESQKRNKSERGQKFIKIIPVPVT